MINANFSNDLEPSPYLGQFLIYLFSSASANCPEKVTISDDFVVFVSAGDGDGDVFEQVYSLEIYNFMSGQWSQLQFIAGRETWNFFEAFMSGPFFAFVIYR